MGISPEEIKQLQKKTARTAERVQKQHELREQKKQKAQDKEAEKATAKQKMLEKEAEQKRQWDEQRKRHQEQREREQEKGNIRVDCRVCQSEKSMSKEVVHRFGELVRLTGWICAIPSLLGFITAIVIAISSFPNALYGIVIACMSFASGIVSWLLLSHRKVFFCNHCGYIIDRADSIAKKNKLLK